MELASRKLERRTLIQAGVACDSSLVSTETSWKCLKILLQAGFNFPSVGEAAKTMGLSPANFFSFSK